MKTLANCTPTEFLVQTNKIRKSVANWLTLTKIGEIRKNLPDIPEDASEEEINKAKEKQVKINAQKILDIVLEEHPEETAELLGLVCFIEPEDLSKHSMAELFGGFNEIIGCKEIIDFFMSLIRLEQMDI